MKTFVMFLAVAIGAVAGIAASQDAVTATSPPAPAVVAEKSEITSVYGTVTAYEPGRSITVAQPDRKSATYAIDRTRICLRRSRAAAASSFRRSRGPVSISRSSARSR